MNTPFFPPWRPRLAALGRRVHRLRQESLPALELLFGPLLPAARLDPAPAGAHSRRRIFSLRRTFFGFLYQTLNPACSCREVVRQIQALAGLLEGPPARFAAAASAPGRRRRGGEEGLALA